MEKYQEKLKTLGYEVDLTGIADNKAIIAHHKYLKDKKKRKEKKRKEKKRKEKKLNKNTIGNTVQPVLK